MGSKSWLELSCSSPLLLLSMSLTAAIGHVEQRLPTNVAPSDNTFTKSVTFVEKTTWQFRAFDLLAKKAMSALSFSSVQYLSGVKLTEDASIFYCCRPVVPLRGRQVTWPTIQALIWRLSDTPERKLTLPHRGRCWLTFMFSLRTLLYCTGICQQIVVTFYIRVCFEHFHWD